MDISFVIDIPTLMGAISIIFVIVLAFMNRLAVDVAAVMALMCIGLIFAN